jgi:hypothetical protein
MNRKIILFLYFLFNLSYCSIGSAVDFIFLGTITNTQVDNDISIKLVNKEKENNVKKYFLPISTDTLLCHRLRGRVIEENSKKPVIGACVLLSDLKLNTVTDENGRFEMLIPIKDLGQDGLHKILYIVTMCGIHYTTVLTDLRLSNIRDNEVFIIDDIVLTDLCAVENKVDIKKVAHDLFLALEEYIKSSENFNDNDTHKEEENLLMKQFPSNEETKDSILNQLNQIIIDQNKIDTSLQYLLNVLIKNEFNRLDDSIISLHNEITTLHDDITHYMKLNDSVSSSRSSKNMPDSGWRIYCGFNYGYLNRPSGISLVNIGLKQNLFFNPDLFYIDGNVMFNIDSNYQIFDQANICLVYRLFCRRVPYISVDIGSGVSYGVRFSEDTNNELIFKNYSFGVNLKVDILGRLFGQKANGNNFTQNTFFYINVSDRIVFNADKNAQGLPSFGLGLMYRISPRKMRN